VTVQSGGVYPTLLPPLGLTDPSLAYGLNGPVDFASVMVFIDLMKQSRAFIGHLEGQWGGFSHEQLKSGGYLDANGWPTSIPPNVTRIGTYWDWDPQEGSEIDRAGDYVMTYEGQGTFVLGGVTNQVQTPGRVTFTMNGEDGFYLEILSTQSGDYLRNFVIVKEDNLDLYNAGAIFNPNWIDLIKNARQVRLMNWSGGNGTTWVNWSDMPHYDWATWTTGVPLEVMVELANQIGADPWFNIPFYVSDAFVEQYAEYVRDNLDPDLVATVEYSNEIWNFSFAEAVEAANLAAAQFGPGGAGWVNYYGKRASQIMEIWTDVFGAETSSRLIRAAGVQTDWVGLTTEIIDAPMWQTADPANYVAPKTYFDALAATTYFGGLEVSDEDVRNALLAQIALPGDAYDWNEQLSREEFVEFPDSGIPHTLSSLAQQKTIADANNLDLVLYEGGQHVHHSFSVSIPQQDLDALQEHLIGYVRSQQMADLYQTLWDGWAAIGDGPFMQFVEVSQSSIYGSWGLRESLIDNTPRSLLLDNLNNTTPAWWENRGGVRFQHGIFLTATTSNQQLVGTSKVDYLIGNSTDNIFYAGAGDDGLNGGGGSDTALFSGNRSLYTVTVEGDGYRVEGPDGSDYLYEIDFVTFADTSLSIGDAVSGTPAPVATFSASPTTVSSGGAVTLTWSSTNSNTCTGTNFSTSNATSGSSIVNPTTNTTYTLTCTGAGGTDIESAAVTVSPAPVLTFSASPTSITNGSSTTLTWSTANATSCTSSGGWSGARAASGSLVVSPTATTTYTLSCTGAGGTDVESVIVSVTSAPGTPAPVATFSASPTTVSSGGSVTLTWSSTNANTCTGTNFSTSNATSGSAIVNPTTNTTYTLTCTGAGGTDIESAAVTVTSNSGGGGGGGGGSSASGPAFKLNERVYLTRTEIVKDLNNRTDLGTQASGSVGIVISNSRQRNGVTYYQVDFISGVDGWVPATSLKKQTTTNNTATNPTTNTTTKPTTPGQVRTTDRVNVRVSPGGAVLSQQEIGTLGVIDEKIAPITLGGYTWVFVKFSESSAGFVAKEFLTPTTGLPQTLTSPTNNAALHQLIQTLIAEVQRLMKLLAQMRGG
jgi:hypothetical protein